VKDKRTDTDMSDDEDLEEREQMEALRREEEAFEEEMRKLELEQKRQMELDARQNAETMDALRDLEARSDLFAESNDNLVGKIVAKKSEQENIKNKTKNFSIDLDADEDVERILKEAREGSERKAKTMANEESERLRKLQEEKARQERLAWAKKEADLARKRIDEVLKATERVEAEKKFIPRLQKELGSPQGFQRFRKASKAYKNNKISAKQYLEMFADEIGVAVKGSQLLQEMLPGLAALVCINFFFFTLPSSLLLTSHSLFLCRYPPRITDKDFLRNIHYIWNDFSQMKNMRRNNERLRKDVCCRDRKP